jgi:hypothetical protein
MQRSELQRQFTSFLNFWISDRQLDIQNFSFGGGIINIGILICDRILILVHHDYSKGAKSSNMDWIRNFGDLHIGNGASRISFSCIHSLNSHVCCVCCKWNISTSSKKPTIGNHVRELTGKLKESIFSNFSGSLFKWIFTGWKLNHDVSTRLDINIWLKCYIERRKFLNSGIVCNNCNIRKACGI